MSVWGPKPFESDGAGDYRDELMEKIIQDITGGLQSPHGAASNLFWVHAAMEILVAIGKHCGNNMVTADSVARWREQVHAILSSASRLNSDKERKQFLEKTLERLTKLAVSEAP